MLKKIIPFVFACVAFLIFWGVGGPLIRQLPIDDTFKGLLIIGGALAVSLLVHAFSAAKISKNNA